MTALANTSPDEAVSWGKIKVDAKPVKVSADATIVFPLIVSQTFVKELERRRQIDSEREMASEFPASGNV